MTYDAIEKSVCDGEPVECYRFAQGSNTWFYTSADADQTYLRDVYATELITRAPTEQNQEDWSGSLEVTLPADNQVSLLWADYLPVSPVALTIYRVHRSAPTDGVTIFVGTVSGCKYSDGQAVLTCNPLTGAFRRPVPWQMYQSQCNHPLYGTGCGVNKNLFRLSVVLDGVSGMQVTAAALAGQADGWWSNGWLQDSSGAIRWILAHAGDTIQLVAAIAGLAPGDTVSVYAGCDRTEATCRTKFSNLDRFGGWSRIPLKNPFSDPIN